MRNRHFFYFNVLHSNSLLEPTSTKQWG